LVLFEEAKVAKMLDGTKNVHLLTTAAFLHTLDLKRIVSYDDVLASIRSMDAERGVLKGLSIDDATEASDHDSSWTVGFRNG
jgi:hypothetical protein